MSLQQQIQREINEEARIDKRIESFKKRLMKLHCNRKYRIIPNNKGADAMIVFNRNNLSKYNIVLYEENNETLATIENNPKYTLIFLKNKNPHDAKLSTYGDLKVMAATAS